MFGINLNNVVKRLDFLGMKPPIMDLFTKGEVCIEPACFKCPELIKKSKYIPERPRVKGTVALEDFPEPTEKDKRFGQCVKADALYIPGGAYKVGDLDRITINCQCSNERVWFTFEVFDGDLDGPGKGGKLPYWPHKDPLPPKGVPWPGGIRPFSAFGGVSNAKSIVPFYSEICAPCKCDCYDGHNGQEFSLINCHEYD